MGDLDNEKQSLGSSSAASFGASREVLFRQDMERILVKLKNNPGTITTEDARRLSENVEANNKKSARIISAIEAFAVANEVLHNEDPSLGQAPHSSLLTIVTDLQAAVEVNPSDVTDEVLRAAKSIVNKMQRSMDHTNNPYDPELEAKLQDEIAKIEPKVAEGAVTKAETDHLHSLEARAHGRTEKGSITAIAQSVVAKRESQRSLMGSDSGISSPKNSHSNSNSLQSSPRQYCYDNKANHQSNEISMEPNIGQSAVFKTNADTTSSETCAQGSANKAECTTAAQSLVSKKRQESLSDRSNVSPRASETDYERRKEQSHTDKEINLRIAEIVTDPNTNEENIGLDNAPYTQPRDSRYHSHVRKGSIVAEGLLKAHGRENSQPSTDYDY